MIKRILVVDDEEDILDLVLAVLDEEGYYVQTSPSGSIFQHVQRDLPDLILLDVLLNGKDGRVLCRQLKANELTKHIPVILFSAHIQREDALSESHADDFVGKPFEIQELLEVVKKHL
ncbi:MAG TPA: response regulator [Ktedonobacteraceae bacterium]|nr:response regulator [Ktedonobacteraceae bacterium]